MPLVTIPTSSGDRVRVRCELHTPWTQLIDGLSVHGGGGGGHAPASAYQPPAAVHKPAQSFHASAAPATQPSGEPAAAGTQRTDASAAAARPEHDSFAAAESSSAAAGHHRVNDPRRQKLLIVASLGVEGGNGWFTHVAEHFASLRDPRTGQPAADVVTFDNRRRFSADGRPPPGEGLSGYRTEAMAADAVALMDALGWRQAHLVGMSLGAMVAAKTSAAAPERVASLTLLGYTLNGWQMAASLVTRPAWLAKVLVGSHRSKIKATLPFYFTRQFLDAPAPQRQQEAAHVSGGAQQQGSAAARGTASVAATARGGTGDSTSRGGSHHGSNGSSSGGASSSVGDDVPVTRSCANRALLGHRHGAAQASGAAPAFTRQDAILSRQAPPPSAGTGDGGRPTGSGGTPRRGGSLRPQLSSHLAGATLGDACPAGAAADGGGGGGAVDEAERLPDTGLKGHSLACLLHWLNKTERRAIANAAFPTTLLVGRHDPVAPPSWVQKAAASLRATLTITEASHAGLTVESCLELLASLELAMFGRTLGDAGAWRRCQDAAIEDAISNAHLIKR